MNEKIGDRIKKLRIMRGLTQKDIATLLDVSPSTIGMYEQNRREPDISTLIRISEQFNVSMDYLLGREENEIFPSFNELRSDPPYFKKSTPWLPTLSDPQDREFLELYSELTPEERQFVLAAIKGMLSK